MTSAITTVKRPIVSLNLPTSVPALITVTRGLVAALTNNPTFSAPDPSIVSRCRRSQNVPSAGGYRVVPEPRRHPDGRGRLDPAGGQVRAPNGRPRAARRGALDSALAPAPSTLPGGPR